MVGHPLPIPTRAFGPVFAPRLAKKELVSVRVRSVASSPGTASRARKTAPAGERDQPDVVKRRRDWLDGQLALDPASAMERLGRPSASRRAGTVTFDRKIKATVRRMTAHCREQTAIDRKGAPASSSLSDRPKFGQASGGREDRRNLQAAFSKSIG